MKKQEQEYVNHPHILRKSLHYMMENAEKIDRVYRYMDEPKSLYDMGPLSLRDRVNVDRYKSRVRGG